MFALLRANLSIYAKIYLKYGFVKFHSCSATQFYMSWYTCQPANERYWISVISNRNKGIKSSIKNPLSRANKFWIASDDEFFIYVAGTKSGTSIRLWSLYSLVKDWRVLRSICDRSRSHCSKRLKERWVIYNFTRVLSLSRAICQNALESAAIRCGNFRATDVNYTSSERSFERRNEE